MLKLNELTWEEGRVIEDCIKGYNYLLIMGMVVNLNVRTINVSLVKSI